MKAIFYCALAALSALSTDAWAFTPGFISKAASVATASAIIGGSVLVSNAGVDLAGSYTDPQHPNCRNEITINKRTKVATLTGTTGNPGCPPNGSGEKWKLTGKADVKGETILVDFTPRGGPKDVTLAWEGNGIRWPNGNYWTKK
jgi:hypothetical protein